MPTDNLCQPGQDTLLCSLVQGNQGFKGILWVVDLMLYKCTAGMISQRIHKQLPILCGSESTSPILENLDLQGRSSQNGNINFLKRKWGRSKALVSMLQLWMDLLRENSQMLPAAPQITDETNINK